MNINEKLFEIRKVITSFSKDSSNGYFKSADGSSHGYVSLDQIVTKLNEEFAKHKLMISFLPKKMIVQDQFLEYQILFRITNIENDEVVDELINFPLENAKIQTLGSLMTYARRYILISYINASLDKDDDGNLANTSVPIVKPIMTAKKQVEQLEQAKGVKKSVKKVDKKDFI